MTDQEYLDTYHPRLNIDLYQFSERVSIKIESGIDEKLARKQTIEEFGNGKI